MKGSALVATALAAGSANAGVHKVGLDTLSANEVRMLTTI